jgi:hypothetical protein
VPQPLCRSRLAPALRVVLVTLTLALAACASDTGEPDWLDRLRATAGMSVPPALAEPAGPDAAAGQPYPNLASVPGRLAPHDPARRGAEIAVLERARAEAEQRRRALENGLVTPVGSGRVGAVMPDAAGAFSVSDEAVLRQATEALRGAGPAARVRLTGPAPAMLTTADRLQRLGVARSRIALDPSAAPSPQVEILVVSEATGR